jgi:hypothetical protein
MGERRLPLDGERYRKYVEGLRRLAEDGPELADVTVLRDFVRERRAWFGPRTAAVTLNAPEDQLRAIVHLMVLAASELSDLHEASRRWLARNDRSLPPWDVTVPRTTQRLVIFGSRVRGVVEWAPERRVQLDPALDEAERRWATALAVGIGECPQWSDDEIWRFAAYLAMGTVEFAAERPLPDKELARRHGVPIDAVVYRRGLPDVPEP